MYRKAISYLYGFFRLLKYVDHGFHLYCPINLTIYIKVNITYKKYPCKELGTLDAHISAESYYDNDIEG